MSSYWLPADAENLWAEECTIRSGGYIADGITSQGHAIVGIVMPSGWDAANLGYEASTRNVVWNTVYDAGGNQQQTVVQASSFIAIPLSQAVFAPNIRIKSVDSAGDPVNQSADRTLIVLLKRYLGGS